MATFLKVQPIRGVKTFRRAGYEFHQGTPTLIRVSDLDEDKSTRLHGESSLVIEEVELDEDDARAQGWSGAAGPGEANDPRTPLEQAVGDYPPPNARRTYAAPAPELTERSPIKPGASAEEKAAAKAARPSPAATPDQSDPFTEPGADGATEPELETEPGGGKRRRNR